MLHVRMSQAVLQGRRVELAMHMSLQGQEVGKVWATPTLVGALTSRAR